VKDLAPVFQLAWNSEASGHVAEAARKFQRAGAFAECWLKLVKPPAHSDQPVLKRVLPVDEIYMLHVVISDDGCEAITGGHSGLIRFWDIERGEPAQALRAHEGAVRGLAATADWSRLFSLGDDGAVRVWSIFSRTRIAQFPLSDSRPKGLAISADGRLAATIHESEDVVIWDASNLIELRRMHADRASAVALSPDGRLVVVGTYGWGACSLHVYDVATGRPVTSLPGHGAIMSLTIARDGKTLAATSFDQSASIWDLNTNESCGVLPLTTPWAQSVAVSHDGRYIIVPGGESEVWIWDLQTRKAAARLPGHMRGGEAVAVDAAFRRLVSCGRNELRIWDLGGKLPPGTTKLSMTLIGLRPDMGGLVLAGNDGLIRAGSGDDIEILKASEADSSTQNSAEVLHATEPFGCTSDLSLGICGHAAGQASIWALREHRWLATSQEQSAAIESIKCVPGRSLAVTFGKDKRLKLRELCPPSTVRSYHFDDSVGPLLEVSRDGRYCFLADKDGSIHVVDMENGNARFLGIHDKTVFGLVVSPTGRRIVSFEFGGSVHIWSLSRERRVASYCVRGGGTYCCFTPDGEKIVLNDGYVMRVLAARDGRHLGNLRGHDADINAIVAAPDGRIVASSSLDGTVRLWDIDHERCLASHFSTAGVPRIRYVTGQLLAGDVRGDQPFALIVESRPDHGPPMVVSVRMWEYGEDNAPGKWGESLEAVCYWCGRRFGLPKRPPGGEILCPWEDCNRKLRVLRSTYGYGGKTDPVGRASS
jgi:WD40 repeat protein